MSINSNNSKKEWSCCFGKFHVQKAVFVIAFSYIILLVTMLCSLTVTWLKERKPKLDEEAWLELKFLTQFHDENLQDELNDLFHLDEDLMLPKKVYLLCFMTISVVIFVGILIYGLIKRVPCCVLPFYSWQIIDLIISVICVILYFHYIQLINSSDYYFQQPANIFAPSFKLFDISSLKFICFTILTFASILILKIYAIVVVWRCFKYLAQAKCDMEDNASLTQAKFNLILAAPFACKEFQPTHGITINSVEEDNSSMLNDSDTTIFFNEDLLAKECGLNLQ